MIRFDFDLNWFQSNDGDDMRHKIEIKLWESAFSFFFTVKVIFDLAFRFCILSNVDKRKINEWLKGWMDGRIIDFHANQSNVHIEDKNVNIRKCGCPDENDISPSVHELIIHKQFVIRGLTSTAFPFDINRMANKECVTISCWPNTEPHTPTLPINS